MIAIQLALCMQLGTLCIQLSHSYSAPKLLEKASFKLEPQYERSVLPSVFEGGETRKKFKVEKEKTKNKKNEKERGEEKEEEIRKIK